MKVFIDRDEFYPIYTIGKDILCDVEIEVPEEVITRYKKAKDDFMAAWKELNDIVEASLQ